MKTSPFQKHTSWRAILVLLLLAVLAGGSPPQEARAQERLCPLVFTPVSLPLTDLGSRLYLRMDGQQTEFTGGLYPDGSNTRPPVHEAAGLAAAARIQPLDAAGSPDPQNGRIVLISIGMSNVNMEFGKFVERASADPDLNPRLVLVNAAQNGQVAPMWTDPAAPTWDTADRRLEQAGVTPFQVQAAWVKQTRTGGGNFPRLAQDLQSDLEVIARNLKTRYPNLQIAYFSSRTASYTYFRGLSPDPQAFETGFSVKWMIEKQIQGDPGLNYDPTRGAVVAPYLAWGPYLWVDGMNPRSDGMTWTADDLVIDCTHPSNSGVSKVVEQLAAFFKSDSTAIGWFLADPGLALAPSPTPLLPTQTVEPPSATPAPTRAPQVALETRTPGITPPFASPQPPVTPTAPLPAANKQPGALWPAGLLVVFLGCAVAAGIYVGLKKRN